MQNDGSEQMLLLANAEGCLDIKLKDFFLNECNTRYMHSDEYKVGNGYV